MLSFQSSERFICSAKRGAAKHIVPGFLSRDFGTNMKACLKTKDFSSPLVEASQRQGFWKMIQKLVQPMKNK